MNYFSGGQALEKLLAEIGTKVAKPAVVEVGFLEGATYPDGTSVPLVATINEFGAPSRGQPPRPFFRNMIAAKSGEWGPAIAALAKANGYDAVKTLGQAGIAIKGQLQASIVALVDPPLAPSTVARKGSAKPLIDTGHMLNSIDYRVTTE